MKGKINFLHTAITTQYGFIMRLPWARDIFYDEKNIFLSLGKKKSDNDGIRKGDGRMTFQSKMNEMLDIIVKWVSESQNPFVLYKTLYDLNDKMGYGHEVYDETSRGFANAMKLLAEEA